MAAAVVISTLVACDDVLESGPESPVGEALFGAGSVAWFTEDDAGAWTMVPLVDGPRVYFDRDEFWATGVVGNTELLAVNRETGAVEWRGPIIAAGNAAIAGESVAAVWGGLPIFDRATGDSVHLYRYPATSLSTNLVSDGDRFYVGTHDGHVVSVDAAGTPVWERAVPGVRTRIVGVALGDGRLATASLSAPWQEVDADTIVVAVLDAATGAVGWHVAIPHEGPWRLGFVRDPPHIIAGRVVVITSDYVVRAFDLDTGALVWQREIRFDYHHDSDGSDTCDGMVVAATGDGGVIALDGATGATRWHAGGASRYSLREVSCEYGTVMVQDGYLQVRNAATGALMVDYPRSVPSPPYRSFMITGATRDADHLYIGTTYGWGKVIAP